MKDKIIMGPAGDIAIAIPLYRIEHEEDVFGKDSGYTISLRKDKPLAYILDMGENAQVVNCDIVEKKCEFLCDL